MSYRSPVIVTFTIASVLFISIGNLFEFAILPHVRLLLSPQKKEVHSSSSGERRTHLAAHLSEMFHPLSAIILLYLGNTSLKTRLQGIQAMTLII